MKKAFITTTINIPYFLEDYCKDFKEYGHKDVHIIVATDKKTPGGIQSYCEKLEIQYGIPILCLAPVIQDLWLASNCPEYGKFLPYNCIQRRNVAILYAYKEGAEIIYTVDDDNFLHTPNYIGVHGNLNKKCELSPVGSAQGWLNVCYGLAERYDKGFFHRGYSFKNRQYFGNETTYHLEGKIVVNAGLWLGDPDVDAVTRMAISPYVVSLRSEELVLAIGTKSPFNSQNTALHRSVIPAYCLGTGLGRYDDIIASYFVKRIADHLKDYISFGLPLVNQKRNEHDLWKDLEGERLGMQLIDQIVEWLYEIDLKKKNYFDCTCELISAFMDKVKKADTLNKEQHSFLNKIGQNYAMWLEAVNKVNRTGLFS